MRLIAAMILVSILAACSESVVDDGCWHEGDCFECGHTVEQEMARADCWFPKYECAPGEDCAVWISAEERAQRGLHWAILGYCELADRPDTWLCTSPNCTR